MVKDSQEVHGIVVILFSEWAAGREREENTKGRRFKRYSFHFLSLLLGLLNPKGAVFTFQS